MNSYQNKCKHKRRNKGLTFSLLVIIAGIALLMRNTGMMDENTASIIFSWPMIIIAFGILNMNKNEYGFGIVMLLVGGYFLYTKSFGYELSFGAYFWPSLFIIIGLLILFTFFKLRQIRRTAYSGKNENYFEEISVFGGALKKFTSKSFTGGSVVNVFGGSKIDFRECEMDGDKAVINLVSVFGGSSFSIPDDWHAKLEVMNIMGAMMDKRESVNTGASKTLVIRGIVIMGGGELNSFYDFDDATHRL